MTLTIAEGRAMVKPPANTSVSSSAAVSSVHEGMPHWLRNGRNGKIGKIPTILPPYSPALGISPSLPSRFRMDWTGILAGTHTGVPITDLFTPRAKPGWISIVTYSGEATGWGARTGSDSTGDGDGCQRSGGNLDGRRKSS